MDLSDTWKSAGFLWEGKTEGYGTGPLRLLFSGHALMNPLSPCSWTSFFSVLCFGKIAWGP